MSYNSGKKQQVKVLHELLKNKNYQVKFYEKEIQADHDSLTQEQADDIKSSKVILCCITKDYCKSKNCKLEIEYARAKKQEIVVLMLENLDSAQIELSNWKFVRLETFSGWISIQKIKSLEFCST